MPDRNVGRGGNYPPNVLIMAIPHFHPEKEPCRNGVHVGIGQPAQNLIYAEISLPGNAPELLGLNSKLFEQPEGLRLAVNKTRPLDGGMKGGT